MIRGIAKRMIGFVFLANNKIDTKLPNYYCINVAGILEIPV
jgi:hypothetical protein